MEQGDLYMRWKIVSKRLKDLQKCIVLPIGNLSSGLCRHRAILFKVILEAYLLLVEKRPMICWTFLPYCTYCSLYWYLSDHFLFFFSTEIGGLCGVALQDS